MQLVSKAFNDAFRERDRDVFIKLKMNDIEYTNANIFNLEYVGGSMGGESLQIGATFANTIKIEFAEIIEGLKENDRIDVEIGIQTHESVIPVLEYPAYVGRARVGYAQLISYKPDEFEYVKLGTFYIKGRVDPNRNESKTTVEAMDAFQFLERPYESKLTYPAEIRQVALEIANLSGTEVNVPNFASLSATKISMPTGYTFRQAIGLIAQFEAGFATFDKDGLLEIRTLKDPNFTISEYEYRSKGLTKNELMYRLGGISCRISGEGDDEKIIRAGSTEGAQIALENRVMTQSLLNSIWEKIKSINYYPMNVKWFGNPALELGDWVTLTDLTGKRFKAPNLNYKLVFDGGLSAESSADTTATAEGTTVYKGTLSQQIEYMREMIKNADGNTIYYGLDEPPNPKLNDMWFKDNGPDTEIWVYKKKADGSLGWVMEISSAPNDELLGLIDDAQTSANNAGALAQASLNLAQTGLDKANESLTKLDVIDDQIGDVNRSLLALDGKVVGLQTTVNGKAEQTQVTQLSNQVTLLATDVDGNKGQITTLSSQVALLVSDNDDNKTQISLLKDNLNLMVKKDDVINQINISTEGILIDGGKTQITGQTFIEDGIIKNAYIADGAINDAKIQNASISSAKIISLDAAKVTANTLSALSVDTGNLIISGWMEVATENRGIRGNYNYGDVVGASYNPRWYVGEWYIAKRFIGFESDILSVNPTSHEIGSFLYYSESWYGADHFKYRAWGDRAKDILLGRVDITAERFEMSDNFNRDYTRVWFTAKGDGFVRWFATEELNAGPYNTTLVLNSRSKRDYGTITLAQSTNGVWINNNTSVGNAQMRFGRDETGPRIWSDDLYKRTSSGSANVGITAYGTLFRVTSARKYKADIKPAENVLANAERVLNITPVSWLDIAELNNGGPLNRYYGFIAEDFKAQGLEEVVIRDRFGEVEGLAYDRIAIYHNVVLTNHEKEIKRLKAKVEALEERLKNEIEVA